MLRENLQDAGQIVQNILTQSLSIPGAKENISLLEAAENFREEEAMTSDLRKIILSFLQFPEPTEIMIRELQWLEEDLTP